MKKTLFLILIFLFATGTLVAQNGSTNDYIVQYGNTPTSPIICALKLPRALAFDWLEQNKQKVIEENIK
jgi:hypothetical protein